MTTALTAAVNAVWREEIDPDRDLELTAVIGGLIHVDSRVVIATGTLGPEVYLRLSQLGYIVADIGRSVHCRHWLHSVAETMRERLDQRARRRAA